jgi:hypothetical protein
VSLWRQVATISPRGLRTDYEPSLEGCSVYFANLVNADGEVRFASARALSSAINSETEGAPSRVHSCLCRV